MEDVVHLCVGGVYYVCTRSLLLEKETTFFFGLLSSHEIHCREFFVDRDPTHFRHVLNWLRGVRYLPSCESTLKELLWEADYYNMDDMTNAIQLQLTLIPRPIQHALFAIRDELRQR